MELCLLGGGGGVSISVNTCETQSFNTELSLRRYWRGPRCSEVWENSELYLMSNVTLSPSE